MKLSFLSSRNRAFSYYVLIILFCTTQFTSKASIMAGCDDFICEDITLFMSLPFNLELEALVGQECDNLSFNPDIVNTTLIIENEGLTEYTIYNLETGDSCTATIDMICLMGCLGIYTSFLEIGIDSVVLIPSDLIFVSCYSDEVFLPPYDSGIFYEGVHDVVIYSPILDDSCATEITVNSSCFNINCDDLNREYYKDTLWPQDVLTFECPDTLDYLLEILDDQGQVLLSGNSIYLEESLPDTVDVRILHIESGNECVGELLLFHNCLANAIDTLMLDFTGLENIIVPWDSLFEIPCKYDFGPGYSIFYISDYDFAGFREFNGGELEFTNYSQNGEIVITDSRTGKIVRKDIVYQNKSLNLLFGLVFSDFEGDCWIDSVPESGPEGFLVYAAGATDTLYDYTNDHGLYNLRLPHFHTYEIGVIEFNNFWDVCISETPIYKEAYAQPVHIGLSADTLCSYLTSFLTVPRFRRCFDNKIYIKYCNLGSDTAHDVILDFYFDEGLEIDASVYGFTEIDDTHYQLSIGTLDPLECGDLEVFAFVDCDLDLGTEICVEVELGPIPVCNDNEQWSGAALDIEGICDEDSVRFIITNIGDADMTSSLGFIVIEDDIMIIQDMVNLPSGESIEIVLPANGSTYQLIADQESFHPYTQKVSALVKACEDGNSIISTGFANSFVLDEQAPFVSIECLPVIGSYDPNDKAVTPSGAYENHIITGEEELEYTIRFENTGTDTAFTVRVVDTLDTNLDLFTFRFAGSSHPVEVEFPIDGILNFKFNNIQLPDTSVDKTGAQGFVKFVIRPKPNLPIETKIYNSAGIYFDFNPPIITNTVDLQVGEYMFTGLEEAPAIKSDFVTPNPAYTDVYIDAQYENFIITDINGIIKGEGRQSAKIEIESLASGIYFLQIFQNGHLIGVDRFVKLDIE